MHTLLPASSCAVQVFVFALASERAGGQLGLMFCQGVSPTAYYLGTYIWYGLTTVTMDAMLLKANTQQEESLVTSSLAPGLVASFAFAFAAVGTMLLKENMHTISPSR